MQFNNNVQFPLMQFKNAFSFIFKSKWKYASIKKKKLDCEATASKRKTLTIVKDKTLDPTSFKNDFNENILDAQILLGWYHTI